MTNLRMVLRGLGWDGHRCGTAEDLVKFSEDLGGFDGGSKGGRVDKIWKEAFNFVDTHKLR